MVARVAALLAVVVVLAACASQRAVKPSPAAGYNFRHNAFDFKYAWKTTETPEGVRVEGLLKNIRYLQVEDVDVTVSLLNKESKVVAEDMTMPVPQTMTKNDFRSFVFIFRGAKLSGVEQLRFQVGYRGSDGGSLVQPWKSTFTVKAATGALIGTREKITDEW